MIKDVAPYPIIKKDFEGLKQRERLDTTKDIAELIFVQSIEGRAHNGAGFFKKSYYVNTTIDDIVRALELNPKSVKTRRQLLIDDIFSYVKRAIQGRGRSRLVDEIGAPLLGIPWFVEREVNPYDVLKGMYIGGLRDTPEVRKVAEEKFKIRIGYGRCYLVNIEVMEKMGFNGESLAHTEHEFDIPFFKSQGLIVDPKSLHEHGEDTVHYMYIRHKIGPGHSDDGAIISAGVLYNADVALGVFLSDAIDTLEKYVADFRDQDSEIADYIGKNFKDLGISMDEVYDITYLAAIPEEREDYSPDSSLRYLLCIDEETSQSALVSHLNFIERKRYFPMLISYNRIISTDFYQYMRDRIFEFKKIEVAVRPETEARGLDRAAIDVMSKRYATVLPRESLKDALIRAREMDADTIIVQDDEKNILGVIDKTEYLHLLERIYKNHK